MIHLGNRAGGVASALMVAATALGVAGCTATLPVGGVASGSSVVASAPGWVGPRLPSVAFVVTCRASHQAPDDPLVHPGHPGASHMHAFFGNTSTTAMSTTASLSTASTTCSDAADRASYWTPAPAADHLRAYYDAGNADPSEVEAFPSGLAGIAGSPEELEPGVAVVAFRCGKAADGPDAAGWSSSPSASQCRDGAVVRYTFGQCADDRLIACRRGQRPRFVRLRLVMAWTGGVAAVGPHADFWNTWDQRRLAELVAVCVRGERTTNLEIKQCGLPGSGPA